MLGKLNLRNYLCEWNDKDWKVQVWCITPHTAKEYAPEIQNWFYEKSWYHIKNNVKIYKDNER